MRVAITHPYSWPEVRRGAERIVVETARSLAVRGHEVTILTAGSKPGRSTTDGVTTIRLRRLFENPVRHERSFAWRIVPYLVKGRYDAVHAMMRRDAYWSTRSRRLGGHRVVFDEMGIPYRDYWTQAGEAGLFGYLAKQVDVYGCMSHFALDVLRKDWGREGDLIPGGVRLDQFDIAKEREPVPTVLLSGALDEPRKGLALLLEAMALVVADVPNIKLWLSGPGDPSAIIAAAPDAARKTVEVLPLGTPEDQGLRYQRAWATCLPSKHDSFGMVLIESLACGTPIVVLNDAAPPQLVTPKTGAIAEPDNPVSLAAALRQGLDLGARPETARHCRDYATQFDWDTGIAPLLERLYTAP